MKKVWLKWSILETNSVHGKSARNIVIAVFDDRYPTNFALSSYISVDTNCSQIKIRTKILVFFNLWVLKKIYMEIYKKSLGFKKSCTSYCDSLKRKKNNISNSILMKNLREWNKITP